MSGFRWSTLMHGHSAEVPESEGRTGSRSATVVLLRPRGRGGVASVIDRMLPHLGPNVRVLPISRHPSDLLRIGLAAGPTSIVHFHPSLRWRAVARDGVLHRLVRQRGSPTLVHWHGVDRAWLAALDRSSSRWRAFVRLFGDADQHFVLVPELAQRLEAHGLPVSCVPNPAPPSTPRGRPEPHRILFLGRLIPEKGVAALGPALGLLRRTVPNATLALAGTGPVFLSGPGIERLGWIDAAARRRELARASVLVLPTRDDAAPMAVLEALAAGVPVVATRIGTVSASVGGYGVMLDRPDPASIARGIQRVWAGQIGRRPDLASHRPSTIARQWRATYEALACGSR